MVDTTLRIQSIETLGTHEGPGLRFVIFLQGCNWRCLYCHNPETQSLKGGISMDIHVLITQIEGCLPYFGQSGGVTVSGGEPLLQTEAIISLFSELKKRNIRTAIDTNGSFLTSLTEDLISLTDLVLLDIKHINPKYHAQVTGCDHDEVPSLLFAKYLEKKKKPFWIRYVLVPEYSDQIEDLEIFAKMAGKFKSLERIEILPYHTLGVAKYEKLDRSYHLAHIDPPSKESVDQAKTILEQSGKPVFIR